MKLLIGTSILVVGFCSVLCFAAKSVSVSKVLQKEEGQLVEKLVYNINSKKVIGTKKSERPSFDDSGRIDIVTDRAIIYGAVKEKFSEIEVDTNTTVNLIKGQKYVLEETESSYIIKESTK